MFNLQWPPRAARATHKIIVPALLVMALLVGVAVDRFLLLPAMPTEEEHHEEEAAQRELTLEADRIENSGIRLMRVDSGTLTNQIIAQATVASTPDGAAIIGARADGTVTQIRKRLGDAVSRGETLGMIQSREAASLTESRASAQARFARAQQEFDRQKNLRDRNATSQQAHDVAESEWRVAQSELTRARNASSASGLSSDGISLNILSPISGRVTSATAMLGSYVVAGTELFRIADPEKLEIQAALPSAEAQRVMIGDTAVIDLQQDQVAATVRAVTPDISLQSRTATVVLIPDGPAKLLQPGQLVSARIMVTHGHTDTTTVLVPTIAVQQIGGEDAVFVRTQTGFRVQTVTTGTESGAMTEIRAGLEPGAEIATANAFLLKAELEKESASHEH